MAHIAADRVKETSTTTGTGNLTLAGAAAGFLAFSAVCANNDTTFYCIQAQTPGEWEVGLGTWQTGGTLVRTSVIASSNAGSAVNLSSGTKDVFITSPAVAQTFGSISPSSITSDQNDYNPTGMARANILRLTNDNVRQITGLAGGYDGRRIAIQVLDTAEGPIILRDQNTSSTAANRFILPIRRVMLWPGDVAELWYDGVSSRWRFLSHVEDGMVSDIDFMQVQEDFLSGVLGAGTATEAGESVGTFNWRSTANGTAASTTPASVTGHPGIIQLVTGGTSGNDTRLHLGNAATDDIFRFDECRYFGALVRTTDNTSNRIKVGLGVDLGDGTLAAWGTDAVMFEFDTATSTFWRYLTRAASTGPASTSSVTVTNNEWDQLEAFRLTGGSWAFMINEAVVGTISSNLPTSVLANIGVFVETQTTGARNVQIDWLSFRSARFGQRYT
jgi:hypothetical protein